jgi:Tfp pilus assembly protein PilF
MRQYESSISIVTKLLEHHPGNAAAEFLLGNCYTAVGNYPAAEKHLAEAIRVEPSKPAYYLVMAQVAGYQGKTEESERSIRRGLAIDPQDSSLLLESASRRESAGDLKGAAQILERLVTKDPASIQAHRLLARIYWRLGKKAEAREEGKYASLEAQSEVVEPRQRNREK